MHNLLRVFTIGTSWPNDTVCYQTASYYLLIVSFAENQRADSLNEVAYNAVVSTYRPAYATTHADCVHYLVVGNAAIPVPDTKVTKAAASYSRYSSVKSVLTKLGIVSATGIWVKVAKESKTRRIVSMPQSRKYFNEQRLLIR